MYVHLNKKITVPNCSKVLTVAWSKQHDYIACGGENGVLKVIKLQETDLTGPTPTSNVTKGDSGSKNFSHNQTLESHKCTVQYVCWNEPFQKLTSSDENGSIVVWIIYEDTWYEEMVNNRNKSLVTGMAWTSDGQKICIVYDDGAIITGSMDGNRIWGKDIKNVSLSKVEWSPDGKLILIGTNDLEIQVLDHLGNFVKKIVLSHTQPLYGRSGTYRESIPTLVCIKWAQQSSSERPLVVAFEDGWLQLMRNESDDAPLIVNCELRISGLEWNHTGDMIAITGRGIVPTEEGKNYLKLYNSEGEILQMVKVPGTEVTDCSWDQTGFKLALAVDCYIFFANIKLHHHWGFMVNSIVFTVASQIGGIQARRLIFWELNSNTRYEREVAYFRQLTTWQHCCAVLHNVESNSNSNSNSNNNTTNNSTEKKSTQLNSVYCINLFNSVGCLLERHFLNFPVRHMSLTSSRLVLASEDSFYVWCFQQPYNGENIKNLYGERLYSEFTLNEQSDELQERPISVSRNDPITALVASDKCFVLGHQSGSICQYLLPSCAQVHEMHIDSIPSSLLLNRNGSRLAVKDKAAKLQIYDFDVNNEENAKEGDWLQVKMSDVWDAKWAADNGDLLAVCEKNRLTVLNTATKQREQPVQCGAHICSFEQYSVRTVLLEQLVVDTNEEKVTKLNDYFDCIKTQTLRELETIMDQSLTDAVNFALQQMNSTFLWKAITKRALESLQLETAQLTMIKCKDYKGIQLVKRLHKLKDQSFQQAEVFAYLGRFEEAEKIYLDLNRPELAVNMYKLLGNYQRVLDLLDRHRIANYEKEMTLVQHQLAVQLADNSEWEQAADHFEKIDAYEQLVPCYINLENCDRLAKMIEFVTNESLLIDIALFLQSMGLCKESVSAYVKANKLEKAIQVCVAMNEWKMAIDLAHQHCLEHIDTILSQYVDHLLANHKYLEVIELYRKANKIAEANAMAITLVEELKKANKGDAVLFKKLFVLIGLLSEQNRTKANKGSASGKSTLDDLLTSDEMLPLNRDSQMIEDPWKGAEAYHFLLLTQRHLYDNNFEMAMKCALHLQDYEEFLSGEEIYCLLALASFSCKCYSVCSRAFIKLEAIGTHARELSVNAAFFSPEVDSQQRPGEDISKERQEMYEQLAVQIFATNPPNESNQESIIKVECKFCNASIADYSTSCNKCNTKFIPCVASGQSIMYSKQQWTCSQCGHHAIKVEVKQYNHCPLCHFPIES